MTLERKVKANLDYHDDENTNKNCKKICKEGQCMFQIVSIAMVGSLYDLLGVKHHVSEKYQQSKVNLGKKT